MTWSNKNIFKNLLAFFVSVLISLGLIELAVRIFMPQNLETPHNYYTSDPSLGWRLKPNLHQIFTAADFMMEVKINSNGFRDEEHAFQGKTGHLRIAAIGDSMLFGHGVNAEKTVINQLREMLAPHVNTTIEVFNFGVPGYNPNQYYKTLYMEAAKYKPDLILVFFYVGNDWTMGQNMMEADGVSADGFLINTKNKFSFESFRSFLFPVRIFLKTHSQAYMLLRDRGRALLMKSKLMYVPGLTLYRKDPAFYDRYKYTLEMIRRMHNFSTAKLQSPFVVCIIPEKVTVNKALFQSAIDGYHLNLDDYDWRQPQSILARYCSANDIAYVDLTSALREAENKKATYLAIDPHWNAWGHRVAAQEVAEYLQDHKIIQEIQSKY